MSVKMHSFPLRRSPLKVQSTEQSSYQILCLKYSAESDELAVAEVMVLCNYSLCIFKIIGYWKKYAYSIFEVLRVGFFKNYF